MKLVLFACFLLHVAGCKTSNIYVSAPEGAENIEVNVIQEGSDVEADAGIPVP